MRPAALLLALSTAAAASAQERPPEPYAVPDLSRASLDALPAIPGPSRAGRLLANKDHAQLERLLARARAAGRRPESFQTELAAHLATITARRDLPLLDVWCQAAPRSAYARLARGEAWLASAMHIRGDGPAADVTPALWKKIRARLRQADADLARASALDPKLARPWALRVTVAMGLAQDGKTLVGHFDRAVALDPNDVEAHVRLLQALSPAWGGSWARMLAFADTCAAAGKREPALYYVLGLAHERAARASKDPAAYLARPRVRDALRPAFAALGEAYPRAIPALRLRARLDRLRGKTETRATWLGLRADAGDPAALYRLGAAAYADGKRPDAERRAGLRRILRAAYLGSGPATRYVGRLLRAKKRYEPCAAWLTVAHARGDADAAFDLALLTWRGRGVAQAPRRAVALFREAVSGGSRPVAAKAQKWLEYVLNHRPELLREKKPKSE